MEIASLLQDGALVLDHAEQLRHRVASTQARSYRLLRTARVLCHRALPSIAGASGLEPTRSEDLIRTRIREHLAHGLLPREEPPVIVGGLSRGGRRCIVCAHEFRAGEPEYEVTTAGVVRLSFHRRCLELYAAEVNDGVGADGNMRAEEGL
jgi:hypothetical protein